MNPNIILRNSFFAGIAVLAAGFLAAPTAQANVYASNIRLNGSLTNATVNTGSSLAISYVLNEPATMGVTLNVLSGTNIIRSFNFASGSPGALRGSNVVMWDGNATGGAPAGPGNYTLSITAAASGYTNWTQTSLDSTNNVAVFPHGIAVDNNTNSPYYGRVVMGNDVGATQHGVAQLVGLYKMNADGSPADEGTFGYAGYTTNDDGTVAVGQMSRTGPNLSGNNNANPSIIRIGEDDRIYWADDSYCGAIVACDMQATTNQIVINSGQGGPYGASPGYPNCPNNYSTCPQRGLLDQLGVGITMFDVFNANNTNAAVFLADRGDYQN